MEVTYISSEKYQDEALCNFFQGLSCLSLSYWEANHHSWERSNLFWCYLSFLSREKLFLTISWGRWEKNCMLSSHLTMEPQDCGDVKQCHSFSGWSWLGKVSFQGPPRFNCCNLKHLGIHPSMCCKRGHGINWVPRFWTCSLKVLMCLNCLDNICFVPLHGMGFHSVYLGFW